MDIFYAFNDAYAMMAGISMFSLLVNSEKGEMINFHIVDSGISDENMDKLRIMIENHNQIVKFYKMPNFEKITGNVGRWNINVFSKLFVGSILPKEVKKVICIDCDTIVMQSLRELWNINLKEKVVAGVLECMSPLYRRNFGKNDDDYYFNSGLLVFDVEKIREQRYEDYFWNYMQKYGSSLAYLDQDVINAVIPQNKMMQLHPKFNTITPVFYLEQYDFMEVRGAKHYYSQKEYDQAKENPSIIHYTTFFLNSLRPWFEGSKHPKVDEFLKYKKMSAWDNTPLWKDNRNWKSKIKNTIVKNLPMPIVKKIVSYLHGVVIPNKIGKAMKKTCVLFEKMAGENYEKSNSMD